MLIEIYSLAEQMQVNYAFLPAIPIWLVIVLASVGYTLLLEFLINAFSPTKKTTNIIIFGSRGSGKTTLWKWLKGETPIKGQESPTGYEKLEQFTVSGSDDRCVIIQKAADYGGGDDFFKHAVELICDKSFIYYLIEIPKIESTRAEYNARFKKIGQILKEKGIKNNFGMRIVATHYDECNMTKAEVVEKITKNINIKVKGENIMVVDLFDHKDVQKIIDDIVKAEIDLNSKIYD